LCGFQFVGTDAQLFEKGRLVNVEGARARRILRLVAVSALFPPLARRPAGPLGILCIGRDRRFLVLRVARANPIAPRNSACGRSAQCACMQQKFPLAKPPVCAAK